MEFSLEIIVSYILFFFVYAFIGWLIEVIGKIIELKKFINRGFLIGPILPIYGFGVLGMLLLIGSTEGSDVLGIFLKSIFICSILEYSTSYVMEKLFKARWWDYSRRKFNINGRICLETMIPFGLLGCLVLYIVHPLVKKGIGFIPSKIQLYITLVLVLIYIIDNIISYAVMFKIKHQITDNSKDNTEYVRDKVFEWIDNNSWIYRRIKDAFPGFEIRDTLKKVEDIAVKSVLTVNDSVNKTVDTTKRAVKPIYDETKKAVKPIYDDAKKQVDKSRDKIKSKVEPTYNEYKKIQKEVSKKVVKK